jgi:hypothetical protein
MGILKDQITSMLCESKSISNTQPNFDDIHLEANRESNMQNKDGSAPESGKPGSTGKGLALGVGGSALAAGTGVGGYELFKGAQQKLADMKAGEAVRNNVDAAKAATVAKVPDISDTIKATGPSPATLGDKTGKALDSLGSSMGDVKSGVKGVAGSALDAVAKNPKAAMAIGAGMAIAGLARRRAKKQME